MRKFYQLLMSGIAALLFSGLVAAESVALKSDHPERYTVQKGDTLWDISELFLRDPWRWPDIWYVNPQIANPHLIYPGDVLVLTYVNGQPRLQLQRGPLKLSPKVISMPLDLAIPTVPIDAIKSFLTRPYVLEKDQLDGLPYIVAFADEHIIGGAGQRVYVRSIEEKDNLKFDVVRPGKPYKDSETEEVLGHEALFIGSSRLQRLGDPATLMISSSQQEALPGDRLIPVVEDVTLQNFQPKAPDTQINGAIIAVLNGVSQIGQYNVVVLDRGNADGLQVGDVLQIDHRGETIRDQVTPDRRDTVKLPDERAGMLLVFRTFDRVSFGIVMDASRAIHVLDKVHNP
ncbi:MAG: LysM peptidoglycan-binding domain-containing protein [Chromatiales bacterium]|jgi:hypothetical protein